MSNTSDNKKLEASFLPALCLDLDGTVRRSKSGNAFISDPEDIEIIPGMGQLIWAYHAAGWLIFGITNQGGVAHGFKTELQVRNELNITLKLLSIGGVAPFTHIFYCPYDERGSVAPFNRKSLSRKPQIGMLVAAEEHAFCCSGSFIDWNASLLVGDRAEDQACAANAQIRFMWAHDFLNSKKPDPI